MPSLRSKKEPGGETQPVLRQLKPSEAGIKSCLLVGLLVSKLGCILFQRWVAAFKEESPNLTITTKDDAEHQNQLFKHQHLEDYRDCTLSEMLDAVMHVYIPGLRRRSGVHLYVFIFSVQFMPEK